MPKFFYLNYCRLWLVHLQSVCKFIYPPFILVDPCPPILTKTVVRTVATIAGIALAPCGIPGKIVGGVIGHVCGSIIADKVL